MENSVEILKGNATGHGPIFSTQNETPLFNLVEDPLETIDQAAKHPEIVKALTVEYRRFIKTLPDGSR